MDSNSKNHVEIWTDGACKGNPGPGGWGALLRSGNTEKTLHGGELQTTNNRMEMMAVLEAMRALKRPCRIDLHVVNEDLWRQLDAEVSRHEVAWHWVKGHAGDPGNERADLLANRGVEEVLARARAVV